MVAKHQVLEPGVVEQARAMGDGGCHSSGAGCGGSGGGDGQRGRSDLIGRRSGGRRRESTPPASELSTVKRNSRAPGWNKRLRIGAAAPSRPPCPNRVSAFEKAVRSFAENPAENVITPVIGTTFDSEGEAHDFYNLYLWAKGFGIRYGKSRLNVERTKCMQKIVCGCSMSTNLCYWETWCREHKVLPMQMSCCHKASTSRR